VTSVNLSELLDKGDVKKIEALPPGQCRPLLDKAESDLKAAADNLESHPDWALAIAYNAMLTAGIALMASKGYKASSDSHHLAVVQFCAAVLPAETAPLTSAFGRYRTRRHGVVYGEAESVAPSEASNAIEKAGKLVQAIKAAITKKR